MNAAQFNITATYFVDNVSLEMLINESVEQLPEPLPRKDIDKLLKRFQRGDHEAGRKVIEHSLRFAKKYTGFFAYEGRHLTRQDLFNEAVVGMGRALERYDQKNGAGFLTYAKWWMRREVVTAIQDREHLIRVPGKLQEDLRRGKQKKHGQKAINSRNVLSLDAMPAVQLEAEAVDGVIYDPVQEREEAQAKEHSTHLAKKAMDGLSEREQAVINLRFGLLDGKQWTLEEIGERFGVTRERVRQIQIKALIKLRAKLGTKRVAA